MKDHPQVQQDHGVVKGKPASEEQEFYYEWGFETLKNNLKILNEVLRQLVTLSASLLGGSIAFLDTSLIGPQYKTPVVVAFFLSLMFAFFGMMPYEGEFDPRRPDSVKRHKDRAFRWKRIWVWATGGLLILGFLIAMVGMMKHLP